MNHLFQDHGWKVDPQWVCYERVIVPEILWLAYLDAHFGHHDASDLVTLVMTSASKVAPSVKVNGYVSSFARLDDKMTDRLKTVLEDADALPHLRMILGGLCNLFPSLPLRRLLGPRTTHVVGELPKLRSMIETLNDRIGTATTYALGHLFYGTVMAGHVKINAELSLSKPKSIEGYPHTVESQLLAASLRSSSKMLDPEITSMDKYGWQRAFWKTCLELDPPKL